MSATANLYANAFPNAFEGHVNWTAGTIKAALMSSAYTPNLGTDAHWSDISAHEASGTGYTAGGVALTSLTATVTVANSWALTWAASTAYTVGELVRPATGNGYLYRCVGAGTSAATAPAFPTVVGETVTDGGVTWANVGESVTVFTSAAPQWPSSTITASMLVIYDATSGTAASEPLVCLQVFAASASSTNGPFEVSPDPTYGWFSLTPA